MFEIDFDINFDHEQMGPPPPLRLSLLPFSRIPSDVFVLISRTRRPRGGGTGTPGRFGASVEALLVIKVMLQSCVIAENTSGL